MEADLPGEVKSLIAFRAAKTAEAQALIAGDLQVRWDLLADTAKGPVVWKAIARQMGPQALRMNLNTLLRHDVFKVVDRSVDPTERKTDGAVNDNQMIDYVASCIADADAITRSLQFPYQFLAAYLNASAEVSQKIKASLHQAAEIAGGNVPERRVRMNNRNNQFAMFILQFAISVLFANDDRPSNHRKESATACRSTLRD